MIKATFVALLANKLVCGHGQHLHKGMRADYHFFYQFRHVLSTLWASPQILLTPNPSLLISHQ
jgi:hypothetical protein